MSKVVVTAKISPEGPHNKIFADAGFSVAFPPPGVDVFQEQGLLSMLKDADAVVAGSEPYSRRIIQSLPKLRAIVRAGVGFDAVDLAACEESRIPVCITPGVNHHAVAEHAISLLMGIARGFPELDRKVRQNRWDRKSYPRVAGKTLGILGLGRIGQATATRGVGLGMKVIAFEPYPDQAFVKQWNIELVDLDTLLSRSDFVSLHLPMSAESRHIINRKTIARMKMGAMLINTARGPLVNEADLVEALKSRHIAAAGLDVFEVGPLPHDSPLLKLDNVLLSGHVAGLDDDSAYDTSKMCAEMIVGLRHGRWPDGCVQNFKNGHDGWKW